MVLTPRISIWFMQVCWRTQNVSKLTFTRIFQNHRSGQFTNNTGTKVIESYFERHRWTKVFGFTGNVKYLRAIHIQFLKNKIIRLIREMKPLLCRNVIFNQTKKWKSVDSQLIVTFQIMFFFNDVIMHKNQNNLCVYLKYLASFLFTFHYYI